MHGKPVTPKRHYGPRVSLQPRCWPAWAVSARAQEQPGSSWPSRPIKMITPLAAGGAADVLGRTVGDELSAIIKQPVVIEIAPVPAARWLPIWSRVRHQTDTRCSRHGWRAHRDAYFVQERPV